MKNLMEIDGYKAVIAYDPQTNLFRGEFVDLTVALTSTRPT